MCHPSRDRGRIGGIIIAWAENYHRWDDVKPEDLRIGGLLRRVREQAGCEVILATSSDVEGEATANYLAEVLESLDCQVTRLAQGLPAGGGLEYADELTLSRAFEGRRGV